MLEMPAREAAFFLPKNERHAVMQGTVSLHAKRASQNATNARVTAIAEKNSRPGSAGSMRLSGGGGFRFYNTAEHKEKPECF